jgi:hypothetical protein
MVTMKNTFESPGSLDSIGQICDDLDDMIHYCSDLQPTKTYFVGHSAQGGAVLVFSISRILA